MRSLLRPLWGSVVLFILGAVAVWFSLVRQAHDEELANAVSESRIANASDSGRLLNMSQREHFRFHQDTAQDRIHISSADQLKRHYLYKAKAEGRNRVIAGVA